MDPGILILEFPAISGQMPGLKRILALLASAKKSLDVAEPCLRLGKNIDSEMEKVHGNNQWTKNGHTYNNIYIYLLLYNHIYIII
jgi:hypothetical protein